MTPEELKNNKELLAICTKETEEKIRAGLDPVQARVEVLKAHGIETDEDAAKAKIVGKMELSDEELQSITGGESNSDNCTAEFKIFDELCLWNYYCSILNNRY